MKRRGDGSGLQTEAVDEGNRGGAQPALNGSVHKTLWYMGVKARVIRGFLSRVLEEEVPRGGTVVDLMSGTGVVAAYCANLYRVFANDVQEYSYVICRSLIEHEPRSKEAFLASVDPDRDLRKAYEKNFAILERLHTPALEMEDALLERYAAGERGGRWCREYRRFLETPGAVYGDRRKPGRIYSKAAELLSEDSISAYRDDPRRKPACLVTAYYASIYFGLRQSIALDSLRAALEDLKPPFAERKRIHYLSALLHAASTCTSGTSHFAQPRHLTKDSELRAMAARRRADIFARLRECSEDVLSTVRNTRHLAGNQCFLGDYRALIRGEDRGATGKGKRGGPEGGIRFEFPSSPDLVYLDPPYTMDHYSRFYHVLEVLARYDYPPLERSPSGTVVRGRYPQIAHRFQSDFCRRATVEGEFRRVARAAAGAGAKLVISYASPSGLLLKQYAKRTSQPVRLLEKLCRECYGDVETRRLPLKHSGQGDKNLSVEELLVICRRPRRQA